MPPETSSRFGWRIKGENLVHMILYPFSVISVCNSPLYGSMRDRNEFVEPSIGGELVPMQTNLLQKQVILNFIYYTLL